MEYVYHCKKNGRDYVYSTKVEFPLAQDAYAWRRGVREYADNYHASVTKSGANAWKGTDAEFEAEISKLCDEAKARFDIGDVPTERGTASPETVAARKLAATIMGVDADTKAAIEKLLAKSKKAA